MKEYDQDMKGKKVSTIENANNSRPSSKNGYASYASLPRVQTPNGYALNNKNNHNNTLSDRIIPVIDSVKVRSTARVISTNLLLKQVRERERIKNQMIEHERLQRLKKANQRRRSEDSWQKKMQTSPFLVNLVAESQRVDEENKLRLAEEIRRHNMLEKRKELIKTKIVLQAFSEMSEMDHLRMEKRKLILEEKKTKALLDLERTKLKSRADIVTTQKAEKESKNADKEFRRQRRINVIKEVHRESTLLSLLSLEK